MKTVLLVVSLLGMLVITLAGVGHIWLGMGDVQISGHGILALVLGLVVSIGLGVGLMALVFISARRGHDDSVGH